MKSAYKNKISGYVFIYTLVTGKKIMPRPGIEPVRPRDGGGQSTTSL